MAMAAPGGTPPGFNPSIGLTSVPTAEVAEKGQVRDSVSIPQSGLQAFRQSSLNLVSCTKASFNPSNGLTSVPTTIGGRVDTPGLGVSIPQSGLQAFRLYLC